MSAYLFAPNFTTASGKLLPQKPAPTLLPSLQFYPLYLALWADHRSAVLDTMFTHLSYKPKGGLSLPLCGSFSKVLITVLLYSPTSLMRFFLYSHTAYLEGLKWSVTANSLVKGENGNLTSNSSPGSLQEAGPWQATDYSPAACPTALCGT